MLYINQGTELSQKNFQELGLQTGVRGRENIGLQQQRRHDEGLECRHRRTKGGARRKEFSLFQGQLFAAEGEQVQYRLQGRPVAHLRRPVGGGLLPCPTRHLRDSKRTRKHRRGLQQR